jgi:hypothetical protein
MLRNLWKCKFWDGACSVLTISLSLSLSLCLCLSLCLSLSLSLSLSVSLSLCLSPTPTLTYTHPLCAGDLSVRIVISGPPLSGKKSLAASLAGELRIPVLNVDKYMTTLDEAGERGSAVKLAALLGSEAYNTGYILVGVDIAAAVVRLSCWLLLPARLPALFLCMRRHRRVVVVQ